MNAVFSLCSHVLASQASFLGGYHVWCLQLGWTIPLVPIDGLHSRRLAVMMKLTAISRFRARGPCLVKDLF